MENTSGRPMFHLGTQRIERERERERERGVMYLCLHLMGRGNVFGFTSYE